MKPGRLVQGFGYPLYERIKPSKDPWKPCWISNALGLCPSELFSVMAIELSYERLSPLLRFQSKALMALFFALQRFPPATKAASPLPPKGLVWVRSLALLDFRVSQVFFLSKPETKPLPLSLSLSFFPRGTLASLSADESQGL